MFKKFGLILVLILAMFNGVSGNVQAKSNSLKDVLDIVSVEEGTHNITIDWKDVKLNFNVYQNDNLVYSGEESEVTVNNLEANHVYTFRIEAFNKKGEMVDVLKLQTSTDNPNKDVENNLNDLPITTIVKSSNVSIDWDDIDGVETYEIYKNGNLIKKVSASEFVDQKVTLEDENNIYAIVGKKKLDQQDIDKVDGHIKENNLKLSTKEKEKYYYKEIIIEKEIGNIKDHLFPEQVFKIASTTKSWDLRYTTFLADQWVENPNPFSKYVWFSGDNRGYNATASSYRTRADLPICFCSAGQSVGLNKYVGTTHGYDKNKNFLDSATASSSGITLSNVNLSSTKISFKLNHAVGNPLVASLDVDYYMNAEFYSNGNYKLSGEHDQAPHHEVYLKGANSTSYQAMYQVASKGLEYLAPPMPNKTWSKSNF